MKILHLMNGKEKFTKSVVDLYNENFINAEHEICYLKINEESTCRRMEIAIPQHEISFGGDLVYNLRKNIELLSLMKKFDYIVLHSFCINNFLTLYLFLRRNFCKNHVVWIEWGADLYEFSIKENPNLKNKIAYYIRKTVREDVNSVVCIFPPDCEVYRKKFQKSKADIYYAPYIGSRSSYGINKTYSTKCRLTTTISKNEPVYIQVGHNGQKQLNHLEALKILTKYKDENIRLFLPLSYCGEKEYVNSIIEYLEKFFPNKYVILKDFMPKDEYFELLDRIDIAIFNTYRQTALSNIYRMIRNNVKLYMPNGSVMKEYFCSYGIPISGIEEIRKMSFEGFVARPDWEKIDGPRKFIEQLDDFDERLRLWQNFYNKLRKKLGTK